VAPGELKAIEENADVKRRRAPAKGVRGAEWCCTRAEVWCAGGVDATSAHSLLPVIQASTTPVILISGMGLLLLTMTNRMGRLIDRTRIYAAKLREAAPAEQRDLEIQLELTWRRAKIVRMSLTFATSSMLMSAGLIIAIFAGTMLGVDLNAAILMLFLGAILLLIAALVAFLRDIFLSLEALHLEVQQAREK